ncbi:MAG: response regulator, partial [Acidobacteriota bacterium]
ARKAAAAADGKEAYMILKSGVQITAAIIDVVMPYIHGTDLVKFMSNDERFKHIPVVIMTAEHSVRMQSAGISSGASAFLPKPFSNAQLRVLLRTFAFKNPQSSQ